MTESIAALLARLAELHAAITSVTKAGDGNMNLVERVVLADGSRVILKRAFPYVVKYPHIAAPIGRASIEAAFYEAVDGSLAAAAMPHHYGHDPDSASNLFEDLGEGRDATLLYAGATLPIAVLDGLIDWLGALHALPLPADARLDNPAMRALNAEHLFDVPLAADNGVALADLADDAAAFRTDPAVRSVIANLAQRYRAHGHGDSDVLLHGDFYPGSWLLTASGVRIIDPEFCWIGPREWDVGVLIAHLWLSGQIPALTERVFTLYHGPLDRRLAEQFAGVEIMRRLLGVAQLPLSTDRRRLLGLARNLLLNGQ
jgi:5-methylthioribose kinase